MTDVGTVEPVVRGRGFGAGLRTPWVSFATRRLGRLLVSMWVLVTASFAMIHLIPGDPARATLGPTAPMALVEARRTALGLDQPVVIQYWSHISGVLQGDLGRSTVTGLPVSQVIGDRLPATVQLGGLAFLVVMAVAVPLGVAMAILTFGGRRRGLELTFTTLSGLVQAIPVFLFGVLLVFLFAITWPIMPVAGRSGPASYLLPVIAMAAGPAASLARIVRVEALNVLGQDYVRTARAKRLPARLIYVRHALRNMVTAALTIGGLLLVDLIAGSVLVETIFAWPGLGRTTVDAINQQDYPVVQGIVLIYGAAVLLVNLLVDLLLAVLDPRSTIREG